VGAARALRPIGAVTRGSSRSVEEDDRGRLALTPALEPGDRNDQVAIPQQHELADRFNGSVRSSAMASDETTSERHAHLLRGGYLAAEHAEQRLKARILVVEAFDRGNRGRVWPKPEADALRAPGRGRREAWAASHPPINRETRRRQFSTAL
jgi:hypothetical protein